MVSAHHTPEMEPAAAAPDRNRWLREGFALAAALVSILVVGIVLTGSFYQVFNSSHQRFATESAGILAQEALRVFAEHANAGDLSRIELGRDTIVTRVSISTGESMSGAFTVLVGHVQPSTFAIKSTGRLETRRGPIICSVDVRWKPGSAEERLKVSPLNQPVCNGERPRSVILVRAHELGS